MSNQQPSINLSFGGNPNQGGSPQYPSFQPPVQPVQPVQSVITTPRNTQISSTTTPVKSKQSRGLRVFIIILVILVFLGLVGAAVTFAILYFTKKTTTVTTGTTGTTGTTVPTVSNYNATWLKEISDSQNGYPYSTALTTTTDGVIVCGSYNKAITTPSLASTLSDVSGTDSTGSFMIMFGSADGTSKWSYKLDAGATSNISVKNVSTTGSSIYVVADLIGSAKPDSATPATTFSGVSTFSGGLIVGYKSFTSVTAPTYDFGKVLTSSGGNVTVNGLASASGDLIVGGSATYGATQDISVSSGNKVDGYVAVFTPASTTPTIQWQKTFGNAENGNDFVGSLRTNTVGDIFAVGGYVNTLNVGFGTGYKTGTDVTKRSPFLVKLLNADGTLSYSKFFNSKVGTVETSDDRYFTNIALTSGSDFIYGAGNFEVASNNVVTYFDGTNSTSPVAECTTIAKFKSDGTFVWVRNLLGVDIDGVWKADSSRKRLISTSDGGVVVVGCLRNASTDVGNGIVLNKISGSGGTDMFIAKLDRDGNTKWAKNYAKAGSTEVIEFNSVDIIGTDLYVSGNCGTGGFNVDTLSISTTNKKSIVVKFKSI